MLCYVTQDRADRSFARRPDGRDAEILLAIARWYVGSGMPEALSRLWDQDGCDAVDNPIAARICVYYDAVGALHKHGLIDEPLLFDWLVVAPVWDRVKGYVHTQRTRRGTPFLWSSFEELARAHKRVIGEYAT